MLKITFVFMLLLTKLALASQHQRIGTLGISPKGQYVALEEYGYRAEKHAYYVTIKILNVWTKEYVGSTVEVELPASNPVQLQTARFKAKQLASGELLKYQISG